MKRQKRKINSQKEIVIQRKVHFTNEEVNTVYIQGEIERQRQKKTEGGWLTG